MSYCSKCGTGKPRHVSGCQLADDVCKLVAAAFERGVSAGIDHVRDAARGVQYTFSIPWGEVNRNRPKP